MLGPNLDVDDVIVLLLGSPSDSPRLNSRIEGITRLEKMFFLFENEHPLGRGYQVDAQFIPHNFGPFSAEIYKAVEVLAAARLVNDSARLSRNDDDSWESENVIYNAEDIPDRYATRDIELTDRGQRYYRTLVSEMPPGTEDRLRVFKRQYGAMPLRQLIRYVYEKPEYQHYLENSIIREQVLGH